MKFLLLEQCSNALFTKIIALSKTLEKVPNELKIINSGCQYFHKTQNNRHSAKKVNKFRRVYIVLCFMKIIKMYLLVMTS